MDPGGSWWREAWGEWSFVTRTSRGSSRRGIVLRMLDTVGRLGGFDEYVCFFFFSFFGGEMEWD